jgi:hypothetical protein
LTLAVTASFTLLAAVGGASLTLWWQHRKAKRDAKLRVFSTLMMYRRANPPHIEWVNALNLIDIAFFDNEEVLAKWHSLYASFHAQQAGTEPHQHTYLEMLSSMAKDLGYKKLQQTDIDKFYTPQAFATQANANAEFQTLVAGFFANVNNLIEQQKLTVPAPQPPPSTTPPDV